MDEGEESLLKKLKGIIQDDGDIGNFLQEIVYRRYS